jgi:putative RecB family exonuclease
MTAQVATRPLEQLRAVPHLSVSQLKTFITCPRKYRLAYIDRVAPQFRPIALAFGIAWHEAIAVHLTKSTHDRPADRNEVKTTFVERLSIAVDSDDTPVLFDEGENLGKTIDVGALMLDVFLDRLPLPERVIGVELPFWLELRDATFGDVLQTPLIGAIDALVINNDRAVVWEVKTAKRRWSDDQLAYDLQPTAYQIAAEHLGFANADVELLITTKTQKPDVQIERVVRTKADRADLVVTAQSVVTAIAAGIDHPIRGWACRGCPYAHACE